MAQIQNYLNRTFSVLGNITVLFLFLSLMAGADYAQHQGRVSTGRDTRTSPADIQVANDFPYRAVAKLFVTFPDGSAYEGTGVFIGADRVFTAAHIVYKKENGGTAKEVEIIPGYNGGNAPFGRTGAKKISVPTEYIQSENDDYDFAAIITVEGLGHKSGWLGYYVPSNRNIGQISIIGYPGDINGGNSIVESPSSATLANGNEMQYSADTNSGMSGAPIIKRERGTWLVIGVHTRAGRGLPFNFGVRFSDYFLKDL